VVATCERSNVFLELLVLCLKDFSESTFMDSFHLQGFKTPCLVFVDDGTVLDQLRKDEGY